jgi:hypothetical protein
MKALPLMATLAVTITARSTLVENNAMTKHKHMYGKQPSQALL